MKKISFDSYEIMADDYAGYVDEKPWNADYERPGTLELVGSVAGLRVLDAGCAAGWYCRKFLDMGAKSVAGIDFSPQMIARCKKRLENYEEDSYRFYCHDLNKRIDFLGDESFDRIVSSLALHYLEDWKIPMEEFHRVLKDKGEMVISVHHPFMEYLVFDRDNYFKRELIKDTWSMNGKEIGVEFYSRPLHEIIGAITGNGFIIKEIYEPMPTENFRRKDPYNYEKLTKRPQFLFIKAEKV